MICTDDEADNRKPHCTTVDRKKNRQNHNNIQSTTSSKNPNPRITMDIEVSSCICSFDFRTMNSALQARGCLTPSITPMKCARLEEPRAKQSAFKKKVFTTSHLENNSKLTHCVYRQSRRPAIHLSIPLKNTIVSCTSRSRTSVNLSVVLGGSNSVVR